MSDENNFETRTPDPVYSVESRSDKIIEKATIDWDLMKLSEIDLGSYQLPDPFTINIFKEYGNIVRDEGERVDDPAFALLDLARRIRSEDGTSAEVLNRFNELVKSKGERLGFLCAIVFLNFCRGFDSEKVGGKYIEKGGVVSDDLQKNMLGAIEKYLLSVEIIDTDNHDILKSDLLHLGTVVDGGVVDMLDVFLDTDDIEGIREKGKPASDHTPLNVDGVFKLLNIIDDFGKKDVVKNNSIIEAKAVWSILEKKKILENKGLRF